MFKAAIRANKIKSIAQLRGATLHAERHDETGKARVREDAEPGHALAWSKADNDRDYLAAFKAHKAEMGAGERKNAPLCMQALCVVSPEWVGKKPATCTTRTTRITSSSLTRRRPGRKAGLVTGLCSAPASTSMRKRRRCGGPDDLARP